MYRDILVKEAGRATIVSATAYMEACGALYPYIRWIPAQQSFIYMAPEFIKMDTFGPPTQAMDVYAVLCMFHCGFFPGVLLSDERYVNHRCSLVSHRSMQGTALLSLPRLKYGHTGIAQPAAEAISDGCGASY